MRIGVDFDNTIVCYDALFHRVALEKGLIPADLPVNKSEVRNHLRETGRERLWTEMQGDVYGARMAEATPFPGVVEFFAERRRAGDQLFIISHKTRHPFLGEKHDLHAAARNWLEQQGFFDPARMGMSRGDAFFELTKEAKLERIAERQCDVFIDDLPEILAEPKFPKIDRILFDPAGLYDDAPFTRVGSWGEITNRMGMERFALNQGFARPLRIEALAGGGNNRVYRVSDGRRVAVLKHYFRHRADMRDRFASERAFYEFLWARGIRRTPEPLAWDGDARLGLFSFVDGRKLKGGEVDQNAVEQALQFVIDLNRDQKDAGNVPAASEACFELQKHIEVVARRVRRLIHTEPVNEAVDFAKQSLEPKWQEIRRVLSQYENWQSGRILSPSDFGFHNALMAEDGRLRFFDFEYAGWDDPAKLVCDFFCQPQVPVPMKFWDFFVGGIWRDEGLAARARALLPAYQIKWCCIMLNEFLRSESERRDFAQGTASSEQRKVAQLGKARAAFAAIEV